MAGVILSAARCLGERVVSARGPVAHLADIPPRMPLSINKCCSISVNNSSLTFANFSMASQAVCGVKPVFLAHQVAEGFKHVGE